jgi:hypothetical protein
MTVRNGYASPPITNSFSDQSDKSEDDSDDQEDDDGEGAFLSKKHQELEDTRIRVQASRSRSRKNTATSSTHLRVMRLRITTRNSFRPRETSITVPILMIYNVTTTALARTMTRWLLSRRMILACRSMVYLVMNRLKACHSRDPAYH